MIKETCQICKAHTSDCNCRGEDTKCIGCGNSIHEHTNKWCDEMNRHLKENAMQEEAIASAELATTKEVEELKLEFDRTITRLGEQDYELSANNTNTTNN